MSTTLEGLRLWLWTLLHKPSSTVLDNIEAVEIRFDEIRERLHQTLERRIRRFELKVMAWGATAVFLAISCALPLVGAWLELRQLLGPVMASLLLALLLGLLAFIPLAILARILARDERAGTPSHK
jgi:hypothetical protein